MKLHKKTLIFLIGLTAVCLLLGITYVISQPKTPTWNGLQPGRSIQQSELERVGALPATISGEQTGLYELLSDIPSAPHTIRVNPESNQLDLLSVEEPLENPAKYASIVTDLGRPKLELYQVGGATDVKVYVYPDRGLAFFVHVPSDTIYRRWYFSPMSEQEFLTFSENQFATTPPEGERYEPID